MMGRVKRKGKGGGGSEERGERRRLWGVKIGRLRRIEGRVRVLLGGTGAGDLGSHELGTEE